MPFKHEWYLEGKILASEIWGEQTIEELHESNASIIELLDSTESQPVHIVVNDEQLSGVPLSIAESQKALTYTKHPKLGWIVMVGEKDNGAMGKVQNYIITFVAKLAQVRYIRVKTFEEALKHLRTADVTIQV